MVGSKHLGPNVLMMGSGGGSHYGLPSPLRKSLALARSLSDSFYLLQPSYVPIGSVLGKCVLFEFISPRFVLPPPPLPPRQLLVPQHRSHLSSQLHLATGGDATSKGSQRGNHTAPHRSQLGCETTQSHSEFVKKFTLVQGLLPLHPTKKDSRKCFPWAVEYQGYLLHQQLPPKAQNKRRFLTNSE